MTAIWSSIKRRRAAYDRGRQAEQTAVEYLQSHGLELLARNYRTRQGEIDIVMRHNDILVFVEVRYRSRENYCPALESIDNSKQVRLRRTGEHYWQHVQPDFCGACRFDVVVITGTQDGPAIDWLKNAF